MELLGSGTEIKGNRKLLFKIEILKMNVYWNQRYFWFWCVFTHFMYSKQLGKQDSIILWNFNFKLSAFAVFLHNEQTTDWTFHIISIFCPNFGACFSCAQRNSHTSKWSVLFFQDQSLINELLCVLFPCLRHSSALLLSLSLLSRGLFASLWKLSIPLTN